MNKKQIYLDNSATTPILPEVKEKIIGHIADFANPSSLYHAGYINKEAINFARCQIADTLKCNSNEIVFTSGSSESNSTALVSGLLANKNKGNHIITSKVEHSSILKACSNLEKYYGAEVTYLDVDKYGFIHPESVLNSLRDNTIFVSIMSVNNELGSVNNISGIASIIK